MEGTCSANVYLRVPCNSSFSPRYCVLSVPVSVSVSVSLSLSLSLMLPSDKGSAPKGKILPPKGVSSFQQE